MADAVRVEGAGRGVTGCGAAFGGAVVVAFAVVFAGAAAFAVVFVVFGGAFAGAFAVFGAGADVFAGFFADVFADVFAGFFAVFFDDVFDERAAISAPALCSASRIWWCNAGSAQTTSIVGPARYSDSGIATKRPSHMTTSLLPQPPPSEISDALRRRALFGLTITYFLQFASMGLQLPFTALAMERAGNSPAVIGAMWGARSLTGAFVPVLWGLLADRLGTARPLLVMSLISGAAVFFALGVYPSPGAAIALFALYGVFATPSSSLVDGMVLTAIAPHTHRYGRIRVFGTVGFGVATIVVSVLLDRDVLAPTPAALFPLCGGLSLVAAVAVVVLVPNLPRPALMGLSQIKAAIKQPTLLLLIGAGSVLWASHAGYVSFLAPLAERAHLPTTAVGFAVVAAVAVEAILMPISTTILKRVSAGVVMVFCAATATARWALTAVVDTSLGFTLVNALHGISFGLFFVVIVGVIAARVPAELRQASQGLLASLSLGVGGVVGGGVVGGLLNSGSPPSTVWFAMAGVAGVSTLLLIPMARHFGRDAVDR
jgi:PPP family 3-phenylpropionic acid transporter